MTPERLAECKEHEFIAYGELSELIGCQVCGRHPDDIIRDLEAQLTAAEEECQRIRDWLAATATPPSPEVGTNGFIERAYGEMGQ